MNTVQLLQWTPGDAEKIADEIKRMAAQAKELGPQACVVLWCFEKDGLKFVQIKAMADETTVEVNRG